jgi:hypothetical protein
MTLENYRRDPLRDGSRGTIVQIEDVVGRGPGSPQWMIRQTHQKGYSFAPSLEGLDWSRVHARTVMPPQAVQ